MEEKKKDVNEKNNDTAEVKKDTKPAETSAKTEPVKETKKEEKPKKEKAETSSKKEAKTETPKVENKKSEVKNDKTTKQNKKEDKKSNWVATVIVVIAVVVIAALLTFMIVTSSDPKKSTDGLLTNLKAGDFAKAQEFLSGGDLVNEGTEFDEETQKLFFDKLEWKVTKVTKEDENNATVEVEITNKDFKTIINNYMQKALRAALGGETSTANIESYFTDELKNDQVQTTTVTKTIKAVKEDKKWKIVSSDDLTDALLPGFQEAINAIG